MRGPESVFIAGRTGFIGRALVDLLGGSRGLSREHCPLEPGNESALRVLLRCPRPPEALIHVAGCPIGSDPEALRRGFVTSTRMLLEAVADAAPGCRVVMVGSAAEIASASAYGRAKAEQLREGVRLAERLGVALLPVRLFNTIGPGQPPHLVAGAMVARLVQCLREGCDTLEVRDPAAVRDYLDVRDVARCLLELAHPRCEWPVSSIPVELCSGEGTSVAGLAGELLASSGASIRLRFVEGPGDRWVGNPTEVRRLLGDRPMKTISTFRSLNEMWDARTRAAA